jgi:hypothetical protein
MDEPNAIDLVEIIDASLAASVDAKLPLMPCVVADAISEVLFAGTRGDEFALLRAGVLVAVYERLKTYQKQSAPD